MPKKLPAFQFYPGDWMKDPSLRSCSLPARGLWIDLLCLMHESPVRGFLMLTKDVAMHDEHIARCVGADQEVVTCLVGELINNGVMDFEPVTISDGSKINAIKSRRMVAEESKREKCSAAGIRGGGNPSLKGRSKGLDGSSSSSSTSTSLSSSDVKKYKSMIGVDEVFKSIPAAKRRQPAATRVQIGIALEKLGLKLHENDATEYLSGRVQDYYQSQEGKSEFWRSPRRWFEEEAWEEPDESWVSRTKERSQL